jgi:hypothetical protein
MINTLISTFSLSFAEGANILLYYLKKIPLIGKKIPSIWYQKTDVKLVIGIIGEVLNLLKKFIFKSLYIGLVIFLPAYSLSEIVDMEVNEIFIQEFFCYSFLLGSFVNSVIFDRSEKAYKMIKLMRANPRVYYFSNIFLKIITEVIFFLPALLIAQIGLIESIILLAELAAFRIFGEWVRVSLYEKYKFVCGDNLGVSALICILILFIPAAIVNLFSIKLSLSLYNPIVIVFILCLSVVAFLKVWNYKGYTSLSRKLLSLDYLNNKEEEIKKMQVADVVIDQNEVNAKVMNSSRFENKTGFDYLNSIFFLRHNKLVSRHIKICVFIITIVFLFATVAFLFVFPDEKQTALELIRKSCPVLIIILFWLSSTQKICKAMFVNCDVSLLKYGFYRDKKGILSNFRSRLKKMIAYNLIPSIVMVVLLSIFVIIIGGFSDLISIIPILICIITLTLFFSIYSLFLYYILQPYTSELTVKSPLFNISNFVLYMICYNASRIETTSTAFSIAVIGITVLFLPISLLIVYKYSYKTFRIK